MTLSRQCALAARRASCILECISQAREGIVPVCTDAVSLSVLCHFSQCKTDIKLLERAQGRAMKTVKWLKGKPCGDQLRSLGLFLEETEVYSFLMWGSRGTDAEPLSLVTSNRTWGNGFKVDWGCLDGILGEGSSHRGSLSIGTRSPEKWSHQADRVQ